MPRSATEHPEKSRGANLLREFEDSLPDFKNLDEEQHLKFVKAIRLLCGYFDISEARLRRDHFFKLRSTIARLNDHCDPRKANAYAEELKHEELVSSARIDGLTGLLNRPGFDAFAAEAFEQTRRSGQPVSALLCDIDAFRDLNERYGHKAGDRALRA
jgi:predicted signal transduction protein with EAL and GGDEF domain